MYRRLFVLIVLCCSLSLYVASAQTMKSWLKAADQAADLQDHYSAFYYYQAALEFDSTRAATWLGYADAAYELRSYDKAYEAYQSYLKLAPEENPGRITYRLARIEHYRGNYEAAMILYDRADRLLERSKAANALSLRADCARLRESCEWVRSQDSTQLFRSAIQSIENVQPLNSPYADFGVSLQPGSVVANSYQFKAERDPYKPSRYYNQLFEVNDSLQPIFLEGLNRDGKHTAHFTTTADEQTLFFSVCGFQGDTVTFDCQIYRAERNDEGVWGNARPVSLNQSGFSFAQPTVGINPETESEVLYFTSDYQSVGGTDIFFAPLLENGTFGEIQPLERINTPGNEATPTFYQNCFLKYLYYSSDYYTEGFGGYDIFQLVGDQSGWRDPENMGKPVNSSYDDHYFTPLRNPSEALVTSNRVGSFYLDSTSEACCYDIYKVQKDPGVELQVQVTDADDGAPLPDTEVSLYRVNGTDTVLVEERSATAPRTFAFMVDRDANYLVEGRRKFYFPAQKPVALPPLNIQGDTCLMIAVPLEPMPVKLQVLTFRKTGPDCHITDPDNPFPRDPLNGTRVSINNVDQSSMVYSDSLPEKNQHLVEIELGEGYGVTSQRNCFGRVDFGDVLRVTREMIFEEDDNVFTIELTHSCPPPFPEKLTANLFFDNNRPRPVPYPDGEVPTYVDAYNDYVSNRGKFVDQLSQNPNADKDRIKEELDTFFETSVIEGFKTFESIFSEELKCQLEAGRFFKLRLIGRTSPIGNPDYNEILSGWRILSIRKNIDLMAKGQIQDYIELGQITIDEIQRGEKDVPEGVPEDKRNGVYSVAASAQRVVEIELIPVDQEEITTTTSSQ